MKRTILTFIIFGFVSLCGVFAWSTYAEYEAFCYTYNIEPNYEEYLYYSDKPGMCYPLPADKVNNENDTIEYIIANSCDNETAIATKK